MKSKRKKIIRYTLLSLLVIIAAAGIYIYKEYNRRHKDTAALRPDYILSATELIRAFEQNEQQSGKKYSDKVMQVNGTIKEVKRDEKGFYSVALGEPRSLSSVRCSIDSLHSREAETLKEGATATVKGICTGFNADELLGSDVILVRGVIKSTQ